MVKMVETYKGEGGKEAVDKVSGAGIVDLSIHFWLLKTFRNSHDYRRQKILRCILM